MNRQIEGSYESIDAVAEAVDRLIKDLDYQSDQLMILTINESDETELRAKTGVQVFVQDKPVESQETLFDKFKDLLSISGEDTFLGQLGIPAEELEDYESDLASGNFLLVIESTPRSDDLETADGMMETVTESSDTAAVVADDTTDKKSIGSQDINNKDVVKETSDDSNDGAEK